MTGAAREERLVVEWAAEGAALPGEDVSGDVEVVVGLDHGALVALIDGLGHGREAAEASHEAARALRAFAGEPIATLVERCHEALRGTRGVAMSVAVFDARDSSMTWVGVGNVEAVLVRGTPGARREGITLRGGVVGYQLPPLRAGVVAVTPGDTLVMATDGIKSGFLGDLPAHAGHGTPRGIARSVFSRHARGTDDALVLVARYLGGAP